MQTRSRVDDASVSLADPACRDAGPALRLAERANIKKMIFVPTRSFGEQLGVELNQHGVSNDFFHGQLSAPEQDLLLQRYGGRLKPALNRIICTNAFGMGVDISDVRLVIHWQQPASPEDYLQEFGRAAPT